MSALARVSLTERGEVDTAQIYVKEAKLQTKHIGVSACTRPLNRN